MKSELQLAIILDVTRDGDFGHINGFIRVRDAADGYGFKSFRESNPCERIVIRSQCSQSMSERKEMYGWTVAYDDGRHMTLYECQKAVKALAPIERKLQRYTDLEGAPQSFGQWINRVARAVGAEFIILRDAYRPRRNGTLRVYSIGDAVREIDQSATELIERLAARVA